MFDFTKTNLKSKASSTPWLIAVAKPLALAAGLLFLSPAAYAVEDCNEEQTAAATAVCDDMSTETTTFFLDWCRVSNGQVESDCCTFGHCYGITITIGGDSDAELLEDDFREEQADTPTSPQDADELLGDETGFEDDGLDDDCDGLGEDYWEYTDAAGNVVSFDDCWTPGSGESPVDVDEHIEDKQPEKEHSGNNDHSSGGGPPVPVKDEHP